MASTAIQIITRFQRFQRFQGFRRFTWFRRFQVPRNQEPLEPLEPLEPFEPLIALFLVDRSGLASFVVSAVGAHAVRSFGFVTVRALAKAGGLQRVVRASLRGACL
jgi:hypothetical protein